MRETKNILITGGSGMIGTRLTHLLVENGYQVSHLNRSQRDSAVRTFLWDPTRSQMDIKALEGTDVIIHLAGAGIADKRWSAQRKKEILESRTISTRFLSTQLKLFQHTVSTFISASGTSYYGLEDKRRPFIETDPPASDFMADVTVAWEKEVDQIGPPIRVVKLRTGVVLSRHGIAMKKLTMPVRWFVGAPLGTGKQFVNWIHIDDVCRMYLKAIEDEQMRGVYNAVAPNPVTNSDLTRELGHTLKRPLWLPPVPSFAVKLIAGDVADVVLKGGEVSSRKIEETGFHFQFPNVRGALKDLLTK